MWVSPSGRWDVRVKADRDIKGLLWIRDHDAKSGSGQVCQFNMSDIVDEHEKQGLELMKFVVDRLEYSKGFLKPKKIRDDRLAELKAARPDWFSTIPVGERRKPTPTKGSGEKKRKADDDDAHDKADDEADDKADDDIIAPSRSPTGYRYARPVIAAAVTVTFKKKAFKYQHNS